MAADDLSPGARGLSLRRVSRTSPPRLVGQLGSPIAVGQQEVDEEEQ